jgi:hypothetical protein
MALELVYDMPQDKSSYTCLNRQGIINSKDFTLCVNKLRGFFESKNFIEVHPQSRLSILAACENPTTISTFKLFWSSMAIATNRSNVVRT